MGNFFWSSEAMNLYLCRKPASWNSFILPTGLICTSKRKDFYRPLWQDLNISNIKGEQPCISLQTACEKQPGLTSVSRNLRSALFFLMLLRRTYTANVRPMMTMMKRPPITPAAIRGVLAIRIRDFTFTGRVRDQRIWVHKTQSHGKLINCLMTRIPAQMGSQGKHTDTW